MIQMLTCHGFLNYHMCKLGLSEGSECKRCMKQEKTSFRMLGQFPVLARTRLAMLGYLFIEPEQIRRVSVVCCCLSGGG